jgi:arginine-tRNA-protein transferase
LKEPADLVEKIYENGFLPIRSIKNVYYLARSLRVDLSKFELSSENRRILRKTQDFESDLMPLSEFNYTPQIQKFCKDYMVSRFGKSSITTAGIRSIFKSGIYNYVFVWKERLTQKEIGYAVCFVSKNLLHYAHAFYDLAYFHQSLGARMILEAVNWAKKSGKKYAFLGTCYDKSAFYKTEFKGVEFFNGFRWSDDLEELKHQIQRETQEYLLKDKDFLERFYQSDLKTILDNFGIRVNF